MIRRASVWAVVGLLVFLLVATLLLDSAAGAAFGGLEEKPRLAGLLLERTTGFEPATLSLGS